MPFTTHAMSGLGTTARDYARKSIKPIVASEREPRLDAAWYNRNSGPADHFHPTLEDGLRRLGH